VDPLVVTIAFGLGVGVIQLAVALSLLAARAGLPVGLLRKVTVSVAANREAVRSGEKTAADIISSSQLQKSGDDRRASLSDKLERLGYVTAESRMEFYQKSLVCLVVSTIGTVLLLYSLGIGSLTLGFFIGPFIGAALPFLYVDRALERRSFIITQHLPIALDQLQIYLSGSLALLPAMNSFVNTTREHGNHNVIAIYFEQILELIHSGVSVSEAFREVSERVAHPALSHVILFLRNCDEHGASVMEQLIGVSEQVTNLYQISIEEKIIRLPIKATIPLFLVFVGFFGMVASGLFVRALSAFPVDQ